MNTENSFAICHVPHTGGTTLNALLSDVFSSQDVCYAHIDNLVALDINKLPRILHGHIDLSVINQLLPHSHKITFLRDPVDRTLSAYNYILRNRAHPQHAYMKENVRSISDFLWDPNLRDNVWNTQVRMIGFDYDVCDIFDQLGRREISSERALGVIMKRRGMFHEKLEESLLVAIERLQKMPFFGIMEHFEVSVRHFFAQFQIETRKDIPRENNVEPGQKRREDLTEREILLIRVFNSFDEILYEEAKRIFSVRFL